MSTQRFWSAPRCYAGRTILCIAGGPSLRDLDLTSVRDRPAIAITGSILTVGAWAPVYYYGDHQWWRWYGDRVPQNYRGRIVTAACAVPVEPRVLRMNKEYEAALCEDPTSLSGLDSGYQAANLAYHFVGPRSRIVLAGYDMGYSGGRAHHHEDYPETSPETNYTENFLPKYAALFARLNELDVEVVSVTPTPLDIPRMNLEEAFA